MLTFCQKYTKGYMASVRSSGCTQIYPSGLFSTIKIKRLNLKFYKIPYLISNLDEFLQTNHSEYIVARYSCSGSLGHKHHTSVHTLAD